MKILRYIFSWFLVLLVFAALAGYFYVQARGKVLVERQLTKFFHQPTTLNEVRFLMPFGLRIKGINVVNIIKADDVRLQFNFPFLVDKHLMIASLDIIGADFSMVRHDRSHVEFGGVYLARQEERFEGEEKPFKRFSGIRIGALMVKESQVSLMDLVGDDKHPYSINGFLLKAASVTYPLEDERIRFSAQGRLEEGFSQMWRGEAVVQGWFNWVAKNMEASLTMSPGKGIIKISADAVSRNNVMDVSGQFSVKKGKKDVADSFAGFHEQGALAATLAVIEKSGANVTMGFHFQTRMDAFEVQTIDYEGDVVWDEEQGGFDIQKLNPLKLLEKAVGSDAAE